MIEQRLKEIKERCDAATRGPWEHLHKKIVTVPHQYHGRLCPMDWYAEEKYEGYLDDADFIARARTDVPMLLEALDTCIRDLKSITNISQDKCKNLAQAALDDVEKIMEQYK